MLIMFDYRTEFLHLYKALLMPTLMLVLPSRTDLQQWPMPFASVIQSAWANSAQSWSLTRDLWKSGHVCSALFASAPDAVGGVSFAV